MTLEAREVTYRYGKDSPMILEDFNFQMEDAERVGMIAPSGYGKTTICKLLSGYLKPERGQILLDGKPLHSEDGYCPVQMIWQQPELAVNPRMRMRDVILEGDQVEERVWKELGIEEDWMNRFPAELSGGELQRFCIARALGKGTRFLLADEISAMLDLTDVTLPTAEGTEVLNAPTDTATLSLSGALKKNVPTATTIGTATVTLKVAQ
ncbi:MAG: ATP-binding cassette domain-containing protein [[Clostridium] scindens]